MAPKVACEKSQVFEVQQGGIMVTRLKGKGNCLSGV